jgi:hypothetical protein
MVAMLVLVHGHRNGAKRRAGGPRPKYWPRLALFDAEGKRAVTLRGATITTQIPPYRFATRSPTPNRCNRIVAPFRPAIGCAIFLPGGDPMPAPAKAKEAPIEALPLEEQIQRRAYELYVERGNQSGSEIDDWLQAEQEVLQTLESHQQRDWSLGR